MAKGEVSKKKTKLSYDNIRFLSQKLSREELESLVGFFLREIEARKRQENRPEYELWKAAIQKSKEEEDKLYKKFLRKKAGGTLWLNLRKPKQIHSNWNGEEDYEEMENSEDDLEDNDDLEDDSDEGRDYGYLTDTSNEM